MNVERYSLRGGYHYTDIIGQTNAERFKKLSVKMAQTFSENLNDLTDKPRPGKQHRSDDLFNQVRKITSQDRRRCVREINYKLELV